MAIGNVVGQSLRSDAAKVLSLASGEFAVIVGVEGTDLFLLLAVVNGALHVYELSIRAGPHACLVLVAEPFP